MSRNNPLRLRLINATKVSRRKPHTAGSLSVWELTFRDASGISFTRLASAESKKSRNFNRLSPPQDNPYPNGISAVYKRLSYLPDQDVKGQPSIDLFPPMGLKSFHKETFTAQGCQSSKMDLQHLPTSAKLMRIQGFCAFAGKRPSPTTADRNFLILEHIGSQGDLIDALSTQGPRRLQLNSEQAVRHFIKACFKLLAFIDYFHRRFKRAILDIKPDNIMPLLNSALSILNLIAIDLGSSVGKSVVGTGLYMDRDDLKRFLHAFSHQDASLLPPAVDFRILANALASCVYCMQWQPPGSQQFNYVRKKTITITALGKKHQGLTFSPWAAALKGSLLTRLLLGLQACSDDMTADDLIKTILCAEDNPEFLESYRAAQCTIMHRDEIERTLRQPHKSTAAKDVSDTKPPAPNGLHGGDKSTTATPPASPISQLFQPAVASIGSTNDTEGGPRNTSATSVHMRL